MLICTGSCSFTRCSANIFFKQDPSKGHLEGQSIIQHMQVTLHGYNHIVSLEPPILVPHWALQWPQSHFCGTSWALRTQVETPDLINSCLLATNNLESGQENWDTAQIRLNVRLKVTCQLVRALSKDSGQLKSTGCQPLGTTLNRDQIMRLSCANECENTSSQLKWTQLLWVPKEPNGGSDRGLQEAWRETLRVMQTFV